MAIKVNKEQASKSVSASYFKPGLNEPVALTRIERKNTKDDGSGSWSICFVFTNGSSEHNVMIFDIDEARTRENNQKYNPKHKRDNKAKGYFKDTEITDDQAVEIAEQLYVDKLMSILQTYLPESEASVEGETYDELYKNIDEKLKGKYESVKVRLKLVYNGNSKYLDIPRSGFGFIERVDAKPQKVIVTSFDNLEAPAATPNPFHKADAKADDDDDLPF